MPSVKKPSFVLRRENITKTFKKALIDKGWTIKHLAELCDMNSGNMSKVINNPMRVRFETIIDIAAKLGLDNIPIK